MERLEDKLKNGLNTEEINEKIAKGFVNGESGVKTRSYAQIVRGNLLTLFNLINVILLICIIISGSWKNALFFLVVIWNFAIGVFQEIRAKQTVEKLSLISAPSASVIRNCEQVQIQGKDIVLGDIMQLEAGNQILCDCVILKGSCQVNESLITGESDAVFKKEGDHLLSGSFVSQGMVFAEAEHVGNDNYVNKITSSAGSFDKKESVIMRSVKSIIKVIVICIIPLTGLFVWNNFFRLDQDFSAAMVKTVAAVSSMIPGGLVLLVSIVLAVSVVRLARHQTLVQDLYSVEYLARVDTLLLDKTGTITEGKLSVDTIHFFTHTKPYNTDGIDPPDYSLDQTDAWIQLKQYTVLSDDNNPTAQAIKEYIESQESTDSVLGTLAADVENGILCVPFSSEKKWGLIYKKGTGSMILGAPDRILNEKANVSDIQDRKYVLEKTSEYAGRGKRVVLFAVSSDAPRGIDPDAAETDMTKADLPEKIIPKALIVIDEKIRKEAPETFEFFRNEGVDIKVISGDNPLTVSRIAGEAGLIGAEKYTDASELNEEQIEKAVSEYTVFGRVKPDQKLDIVKALQKQGHVVAMTGDGANDVLALRAADCSIAMQSGTDAARYAANIVLLDSDFSSMPLIVAEGRKSINNLQRSASLYLTKTVYSFIFAAFFIFAVSLLYPFENIQVTLIGAVTIGIPSFFLALEPNSNRVSGSFLRNVFNNAVPAGILESACLIITSYILKNNFGADQAQLSTAATYLMLIMGLIVVIGISGRLRLWKAGLILLLAGIAVGAALIFPSLLSLVTLNAGIWKCLLISAAAFAAAYLLTAKVIILAFIRKFNSKKQER